MTHWQFGGTVLYVQDVPAIADFYKRAFGLQLRFCDEALGFAELETGGSLLAVASESLGDALMPACYSRPIGGQIAGAEIALFTSDVPAAFNKAAEEGAVPIEAPRRMPWGLKVAYVRAPEGTMVGFSERPKSVRPTNGTALIRSMLIFFVSFAIQCFCVDGPAAPASGARHPKSVRRSGPKGLGDTAGWNQRASDSHFVQRILFPSHR